MGHVLRGQLRSAPCSHAAPQISPPRACLRALRLPSRPPLCPSPILSATLLPLPARPALSHRVLSRPSLPSLYISPRPPPSLVCPRAVSTAPSSLERPCLAAWWFDGETPRQLPLGRPAGQTRAAPDGYSGPHATIPRPPPEPSARLRSARVSKRTSVQARNASQCRRMFPDLRFLEAWRQGFR